MTPIAGEDRPRVLFVTGRLAEFALRRVLDDLADRVGFRAEVAVLPISVAALMPTHWIARHLPAVEGIARVVLPGLCQGELKPLSDRLGPAVAVERGPEDLRDLPRHFGLESTRPADYGDYSIEILAEINHAPRLDRTALVRQARRFRDQGADLIDLGCDPGGPWSGIGDAVKALRDEGLRVSIDSFDPTEVVDAVSAGAELVLSVNASNRDRARDWGVEVVALPDRPGSLDGLDETVEYLSKHRIAFRIDPILEPIGFGFAKSLGRYLEARARHADSPLLLGIGNISEMTEVDSAGVNVLLLGFCEELAIGSVLTTAVANWASGSVREIDLGRRLVRHSVGNRVPPKKLEPRLVCLRDPKVVRRGEEEIAELKRGVKDPNWRLFAEDQGIVALNREHLLVDRDPFALFEKMNVTDPSHAFYLGYEMMKARTALTLGKTYRQDRELEWGYLTESEDSNRDRGEASP